MAAIKLLHWQRVLVELLLMGFLIANVLKNGRLIETNGAHTVSTRPKVIPGNIFAFAKVTAVDQNGRLAFQPPYRLRHAISWRNAQTHVDMVWERMPLNQTYPKLGT